MAGVVARRNIAAANAVGVVHRLRGNAGIRIGKRRSRHQPNPDADREQSAQNSFFHLVSSVPLPSGSLKSNFISNIANNFCITSVAMVFISSAATKPSTLACSSSGTL